MRTSSSTYIILFVFYLYSETRVYSYESNVKYQIKWPRTFYLKGDELQFHTNIKKTFEIWYSSKLNRSRIDVGNGAVRKYYYSDKQQLLTLQPITNEADVCEIDCSQKDIKLSAPPTFLPAVSYLNYTGRSTDLFDKIVDIWTGSTVFNTIFKKEDTLYVYRTDEGFDVPVQHVVKVINPELGVLRGHTVSNYYNFNKRVTVDDLTVPSEDCSKYTVKPKLAEGLETVLEDLHPDMPGDAEVAFESYVNHHGKDYQDTEYHMRKTIFEKNWRMIDRHNRHNHGYKLSLNEFSDQLDEELKFLRGTIPSGDKTVARRFPHTDEEVENLARKLPKKVDLRILYGTTPVKHQGQCGACWAFATTGAVEMAIGMANGGRFLDLSEQSVLDCGWDYGNFGCQGGYIDHAMQHVVIYGIPTEEEYGPYNSVAGFCRMLNMTTTYKISGFGKVTPRNPKALKVALHRYGPVVVGLHASKKMGFYSSGIFYDEECVGKKLNHGMIVVGYGSRKGQEYWILKNSWGEKWGEDGYVLMSTKNNNCFVLDEPHYPIV